jgi:hypothetical protein
MASRVQAVDTKLLITDSSSYPMAKEVARLCGDIKVISIDNVPGIPCMQHLITGGDPTFNDFHLDTPEEAEAHTAMIFRTY